MDSALSFWVITRFYKFPRQHYSARQLEQMASPVCIKDGSFWTRIVIGGVDFPGEEHISDGHTFAVSLTKHLEYEQNRPNISNIIGLVKYVEEDKSGIMENLLKGTIINTKRIEPDMHVSKSVVRFGFILDALFQALMEGK